MKVISKTKDIAGRPLTLETGRLAPQATASVLASYGQSTVLVAVTLGQEDLKKDYFPLSVEYQERLYAGGRIKGSRWVKREGRPTDAETLSARLIDRSIRPLFPKSFRRDVQVIITVLSVDILNDTDILASVATSAALSISPIPWNGPIGTVRVGLQEGSPVINPTNGNGEVIPLDLVISSTSDLITMIEAGGRQIPDEQVLTALETGFSANREVIALINELVSAVSPGKLAIPDTKADAALVKQVESKARPVIESMLEQYSKQEGGGVLSEIKKSLATDFPEADPLRVFQIVEELLHRTIRTGILEKKRRPDGRKLDEIRTLQADVAVIPRVHGSALFQRGQTQALTITTLGAPSLSQSLESAEGEETKRYMHHYNFPPYSTGETGRVGSPSRREIGHGALAEKALTPVIPSEADFPYAIRVVSEITSSNGSTSMASVCGSTLSLMDAGVPILAPVAGISTGLVTQSDYPKKTTDYVLLTDIIGLEDHHGDMDFKIAGTKDGVTAIQLDVKVPGITLDICRRTFAASQIARSEILKTLTNAISEPRKELSAFAPKISTVQIPVDKIGELIGPGGKVIRKLMAETETVIDVQDDGSVFVSGLNQEGMDKALNWIGSLGKEVVPGEIYEGTVARIQPFGAFVNILPGKDGLVHVSQMAPGFVSDPGQIVNEGDIVKVWVTEIDSQGRINLSMLFDDAGQPVAKARDTSARPMRSEHFRGPVRSGGGQGDRDRGRRPPGRSGGRY